MDISLPITTERLVIRSPRIEDAATLFQAYTHDPEITKYLSWKTNETLVETQAFLKFAVGQYQKRHEYHLIIELKDSHEVLGMCAVVPKENWVEIGYVLKKSAWGKGYMTEVAKKLIETVFSQTNFHEIHAFCDQENKASERVMMKAGLKFMRELPKYSLHPNFSTEKRDCYLYGITKAEFTSL